MKKFYFLASVLLATLSLKAQETITFEEFELAQQDTFINQFENNQFTSQNFVFEAVWSEEFGGFFSNGFVVTNITDNTTAGFTNQYSGITAKGANDSEKYTVLVSEGTISIPENSSLVSAEITNTTYAYFSMRDGDGFGKKFGTNVNANGEEDGTDGDDYFYIKIHGWEATDSTLLNSVDFYLADFRSENETEHYILDEWTTVDLSSLANADYLTFEYFSSDIGEFGINTPKYIAIDNIKYTDGTSGISTETIADFVVYPNPAQNVVNIQGENGVYSIFAINGSKVMEIEVNGITSVDVSTLDSGIYFVKSEFSNSTQKLIIQ